MVKNPPGGQGNEYDRDAKGFARSKDTVPLPLPLPFGMDCHAPGFYHCSHQSDESTLRLRALNRRLITAGHKRNWIGLGPQREMPPPLLLEERL